MHTHALTHMHMHTHMHTHTRPQTHKCLCHRLESDGANERKLCGAHHVREVRQKAVEAVLIACARCKRDHELKRSHLGAGDGEAADACKHEVGEQRERIFCGAQQNNRGVRRGGGIENEKRKKEEEKSGNPESKA